MKKLKFMLAAATAIGLASATQADQYNTTGLEKLAVGTNVTTGAQDNRSGYSYFYYAVSGAEDNESVIAEGTPNIARPRGASAVDADRNKILQVSTGTDPLMRTYKPLSGGAPQAATELASDTYVDTLVQFTVTPYTDTVTPGANDKLMIYLKESVTTNSLGEITDADTNLVVVGGFYSAGATTVREYVLNTGSVTVNPNEWHRLTVKAVRDISDTLALGLPGFAIWVDGEACTLDYYTLDENDPTSIGGTVIATNADVLAKKLVLSLLTGSGGQTASLQGVGFAGEGKVDDIVFSDVDPFATVFDFTFTIGTGATVTYTVGGTEYDQTKTFPEVEAGTAVQITSITYADDYMAGSTTAVNLSDPVEGVYTVTNAGASLTITPAEAYASVSGSKFGSFAEAISAAANGDTVTLLRDAEGGASFTTAAATLDLNGKTISGPGVNTDMTITFTGAEAKTLKGGEITNCFKVLTLKLPDNQDFTIEGMTFHADVTPSATNAANNLFFVTNCTFKSEVAKNGSTAVGEDRHSYGVILNNANFGQVDIVDNYFQLGRRSAVEIACNYAPAPDVYFYGNTVDASADPLTTSERTQGRAFPALQVFKQGRVFIENNTFTGSFMGEPFGFYNDWNDGKTVQYVSTSEPLVFSGNTVASTVQHLWAYYVAADDLTQTNAPNVFFGENQINGIDTTQGIYKALVQSVPVAYSTTLALPTGVASVYAWTHADGATDYYVNDTAAADLGSVASGDTIVAVPGADVTLSVVGLKLDADATYKNKWAVSQLTSPTTELEPGEQSSTQYETLEEAQAAAGNVTIVASDAVVTGLGAEAAAAYTTNFEVKVVAVTGGSGSYAVVVDLKDTSVSNLQEQVNADVAAVVPALGESTVTVNATPGFYYSVSRVGSLPGDFAAGEGDRVLANGSTVELTMPAEPLGATAGFYKVMVNIVPKTKPAQE